MWYELTDEQIELLEDAFEEEGMSLRDYGEEVAAYLEKVADKTDDPGLLAARFREQYQGTYNEAADWAKEFFTEVYGMPKDLPDFIADSIDWESVADECFIQHEMMDVLVSGGVAIFDLTV